MFKAIGRFFSPDRSAPLWIRIMPYATLVFAGVVMFLVAGAGWEYTNSSQFCGTTCHTMPPEYISYLHSPHSNVKCVECHIGRATIATQFTRKARDITVVGYGASDLDDYVEQAATAQDRVVRADPQPEKGYYYRSDHFSFAKVGVPSLYMDPGTDNVEHGEEWAMAQLDDYTQNRYHKVSDEYSADWDMSGMETDLRLMFRIAWRLANETTYPEWRDGNEFKAIREADRSGRGM